MKAERSITIHRSNGTPRGFALTSFDNGAARLVIRVDDTARGRRIARWFFENELPTMLPRRIPWRHVRAHGSFEWIDRNYGGAK